MSDLQTIAPLTDQKVTILTAEYQANVDLWIYEVTFRQERSQAFLAVNTVLLVALGALTQFSPTIAATTIAAIPISFFGVLACVMWYLILIRNSAYLAFRLYQLRTVEAKLPGMTTIANQWRAMSLYETLHTDGLEPFAIRPAAKRSSLRMENRLPLILAGLWALGLIAAVTVLILHLTGWV
jgi:hypothetical protein